MSFEILDETWASEVQAGLSEYIDNLIYGIDSDEEEYQDTESGQPFCGCDVCYWREVLTYTTTRILEGQKRGKIALVENEQA